MYIARVHGAFFGLLDDRCCVHRTERDLFVIDVTCSSCGESTVFGQKTKGMISKTVRDLARMSSGVHFEAVCDSILIKNFVELYGIGSQTVLVTHIDGDRPILPQTLDELVNESQGSVGSPSGENVGLRRSILRRQVEIKRRILRVR